MDTGSDTLNQKLKLLSTQELDEVAELVAEIVQEQVGALAVSVLLWDADTRVFW